MSLTAGKLLSRCLTPPECSAQAFPARAGTGGNLASLQGEMESLPEDAVCSRPVRFFTQGVFSDGEGAKKISDARSDVEFFLFHGC